jgi:uncharacterized OsmC-like protein
MKEETYHIIAPILIALSLMLIIGIEGCTTLNVNMQCADTDNGNDASLQGTVTSGGASLTDFCVSDSELMEYYCSGDVPMTEVQYCSKGCSNGACMKSV